MKGKNFQIIVLVVFIIAAIFGVLVFSGAIPIGQQNTSGGQGTVVLWGTFPAEAIAPLIENFNQAHQTFVVKYVEKSADTFDQDLLEALASGTGPDMFFLPDNLVYHYKNKILTVPYTSFPLSTFQNSFAEAGEVFLTSTGVLAFPMDIDPLVMYYNRGMLDTAGITAPPVYWGDVVNMVPKLTQKDASGNIVKSAVALGQFANITHAKDILSALFMQGGNPIISEDPQNAGSFISRLGDLVGKYDLSTILQFYTEFADPLQNVYSWNRSFSSSSDAFSSENLAFYFGYGSELQSLVNKNPNEDFLPASFPQIKGSAFKLTFGRVTGIAISSFSKNISTAITAAGLMSSANFAAQFDAALGVAPARRDLLSSVPSGVASAVLYPSALYAKSWLDPSSADTDNIFQGMVENVLSNSMTPQEAIKDASDKLDLLLAK
jgi:ABC-type glycerol-3-phosphate transport system substrate-binding protein